MSHCKLQNKVLKVFYQEDERTEATGRLGQEKKHLGIRDKKNSTWALGPRKQKHLGIGDKKKSTWAPGPRKKAPGHRGQEKKHLGIGDEKKAHGHRGQE